MICPTCGCVNLPGNEACSNCQQDLTPLDRPSAQNRVERSLMEDPVGALNPGAPITLPPDATVQRAMETLLDNNCGTILVVDAAGKLLGIFSERDLLKKVAGLHDDYTALHISQFMTPDPETVGPKDTLAFALHKMDSGGYRHIPILHAGKPVGILSVRDMLRHITRLCKDH